MTRILRLLLIAAIALPLWQPMAAQEAIGGDVPVVADVNDALMHPLKARLDAEPYKVVQTREAVPSGYARVTLAVGIQWNDGYGYQILLDPDHTAYSYTIQDGGWFSNSITLANYGSINEYSNNYNNTNIVNYGTAINGLYNQFEYKIPENANAAQGTQNVIVNGQGSILIPAGTYDFAIAVPATYPFFASSHGEIKRSDWNDYVFESGKSYVFYVLAVQENGTSYDAVFLELSAPYMALLSGDGEFGNVQIGEAKTTTLTVMNTGEEAFTPKVACDNPAFTITSTSSGLLASGASRNYVVTFAPTDIQDYNATFTVTAEETEAYDINYTTRLTGTGVGDGHQGDVAAGTNQSGMFPVYGRYFHRGTSSQMIYPGSMLTQQGIKVGDAITSLTFYVNSGTVPANLGSSTVTLRLGQTTATTVTSQNIMTNNRNSCTRVFEGNLTTGQNTLTIDITPFQYQGDNLLVDFVVTGNGTNYTYAECEWVGENNHTNASYNIRTRSNGGTETNQGSFLPKMEIGYSTMPELEATTSIDFGTVSVGNGEAKTAIIKNESNEEVQATITVSPNPPFSVANSTITIAANSFAIIPVTFMPKTDGDYSGTLTVGTITIPLTGTGVYSGAEATRDKEFFDGITYKWPINVDEEDQTESTLSEIATDPEQIIAMLREIYTNKDIPGNYYRGHTATGGKDHDNEVPYTGVGIITSNTATECDNSYGWNIPGNVITEGNYRYMDPEQYKPNEEGVTLLLVEMVDDFKKPDGITEATTTYEELKNYIEMSIKSVRVITDARRTGEGIERGTLFKIDCDKMNKFYLIAKGQLLWFDNLKSTISYSNPAYYNGSYSDEGLAFDYLNGPALLCHMFEQFSPSAGNAEVPVADLYWDLIDMQSFGVIHDCPNVPFVQNGHHFMMYGADSEAADCQDVRDMMFFVPDYRMLEHINRGSGGLSANRSQDYFRYNTKHQPTMGLFVIHQNDIPVGASNTSYRDPNNEEVTGLYNHQLSWKSNLDDYLPGEEQYYELWEIVVDDFGMESYVPVYCRDEQGRYQLNNNTWVSDTTGVSDQLKPVKLERVILETGQEGFSYTDVYVDMKEYSQTKTYVIRGRDQGEFLSLQMSNQQEIVIPGTDLKEKARMIAATYYSRYNPENEKNCYSNKIELSNNGMTLTESDLANGLVFYRSSRAAKVDANGNVDTDADGNIQYAETVNKETFATGTASNGTLTITLSKQSPSSEYPNGAVSGTAAGYHANTTLSFPYSTSTGVVQFTNGLSFWDNFTVDVDKNAHPLQYNYKMEIGEEGQNGYAYSNNVRVPVYKTDTQINSYTQSQVDGDTIGNLELEDVEFSEKVQLSSKTEILRYDVYRWKDADKHAIIATVDGDDEQDLPPTGIAGNQGESYSITMNETGTSDYYVGDAVSVSTANPQNWAKFVDYYPNKQDAAHDYLYAPVVELRTKGYKSELDDQNNKVPRDDYNTYGGPMQRTASGELNIGTLNYDISEYSWLVGSDRYAYYTVTLPIIADEVPAGYKIYKVRAWRQLAPNLLDEPIYTERKTKSGKYCFEDINGGDYQQHMVLGADDVDDILDNNGNEVPVCRGTFGARKVTTTTQGVPNDGCLESLPMTFQVRLYFTLDTQKTPSNAPGIRPRAEGSDSQPYYIVEYTTPFTINGGIPTGVVDVMNAKQAVGVKYYNVAGIESDTPFQGVNIVVTRYSDGSKTTTKILK